MSEPPAPRAEPDETGAGPSARAAPGGAAEAAGGEVRFRGPAAEDGAALWALVKESGKLDVNSPYFYVLFCTRLADTCVIAERDGQPVGFVLGIVLPDAPDAVFVWQVGVAAAARGQGLGKKLLHRLLERPGCRGLRYLEATVTPSNEASRALFRALARDLGTECTVSDHFAAHLFPGAAHEQEDLFRIGPFGGTGPAGAGAASAKGE